MLSCYHHAVAPRHRFAVRHAFNNTKSFVAEQVIIYSLLPM